MTIDEARAHQQYDDCMFCPGCSKLLTGLHTGSMCYINWIEKKAQQILKNSKKDECRVLIGGSLDLFGWSSYILHRISDRS